MALKDKNRIVERTIKKKKKNNEINEYMYKTYQLIHDGHLLRTSK